jgi:hypothetical protein
MDNERDELQAAINEYAAAEQALNAVHTGGAELRDGDNVLRVPGNYDELLATYRKAASRYADALEANGYSVPIGLREEIAQA